MIALLVGGPLDGLSIVEPDDVASVTCIMPHRTVNYLRGMQLRQTIPGRSVSCYFHYEPDQGPT
jgi:hypothetical protein